LSERIADCSLRRVIPSYFDIINEIPGFVNTEKEAAKPINTVRSDEKGKVYNEGNVNAGCKNPVEWMPLYGKFAVSGQNTEDKQNRRAFIGTPAAIFE
jgi:hypothetical protein